MSLATALHHLRTLADARDDLSDADLLARFRDKSDEAAFALLVQRHGPMVLGVCRRVLGDWHDAEDAFQATFLVLARAAAVIRKQSSLASWLYGVAQRTAGKARLRETALQVRQRKGAAMRPHESPDPSDRLSRQDLRGVLDEELSRLPEHYQAPIVLYYLEGKSSEQAARELGIPRGTLSSRLAKGREILRDRLQERGLTLTGSLLAGPMAREAVPASLTLATVRAASSLLAGKTLAGLATVKATRLAETVTSAMGLGRLKSTTTLLLLAGVLLVSGTGAWRLSAPPASASPQLPEAPAVAKEKADRMEVRGRVLGPDGQPFAGARLYLGVGGAKEPTFPVRATSGSDGRFTFAFGKAELEHTDSEKPSVQVMAVATGYGCDWAEIDDAKGEVTIRLVKDVPIAGRIVDLEGKAVVGAKVTVWSLLGVKGDNIDAYLESLRRGNESRSTRYFTGPLPGQPSAYTTDRDGRFRLTGVGQERVVIFRVEGRNIEWTSFEVMTRPVEPIRHPKWNTRIYGASFTLVGNPSRPIRGVVRDKESGKPLPGVSVGQPGNSWFVTTTDREGRFELRGFAKQKKYSLLAKPADGGHFQRWLEFQDTPGFDPLTCDIDLVRGLTVRGKVVDQSTGKPIAGATVEYHPLGGNQHVDKLLPGSWDPRSETTTAPDGSYSLTVLPGPGVLAVKSPKLETFTPAAVPLQDRKKFFKARLVDDTDEEYLTRHAGGGSFGSISPSFYNAIVLMEPEAGDTSLTRDVALQRPQARKGRIVGPDDRPLAGVTVYGLRRFGIDTMKDDQFTVQGINPKAKRPLVFFHKEKKLGFYLKDLRDEAAGSLTVKLQPCGSASGRVVDGDGRPVVNLPLHVWGRALRIIGESGGGYHGVMTDNEGRFRVEGLVPNQAYAVQEWDGTPFVRVHGEVTVKSGAHQDMGDLKRSQKRE